MKPPMNPPVTSGLEALYDVTFAAELASREKQVQQAYRPVIGIHKWFARRPGTLFRALMLAEYAVAPVRESFWQAHQMNGIIGDPFMGGGTPVFEANRLGFHVVACDINPMAYWIVRQSLAPLDIEAFRAVAASVVRDVEVVIGRHYTTRCLCCGQDAQAKYFLWVKTTACTTCGATNDLFPSYRLALPQRHPRHVVVCPGCGALNEYARAPMRSKPAACRNCNHAVQVEGNVSRSSFECRACKCIHSIKSAQRPPTHRMWAIEYNCSHCYASQAGRQFKPPDREDLARFEAAEQQLNCLASELPIPNADIPPGDESRRLHRWGYRRYRELFNGRQLLGLGVLLRRVSAIEDTAIRQAMLTVFSDCLRYQNMLCRYDTYALKCQDIFSVHGFPVALVQCENSLLGIPRVGSGSFRHFIDKYTRAKRFCRAPFETRPGTPRKQIIAIAGETIEATLVDHWPSAGLPKQAMLVNAPSQQVSLLPASLDGVFTDPPYFDNVQYAELIDFCFTWLRQALEHVEPTFARHTTRSLAELTGNQTLGKDLVHFATGISEVFQRFAGALKPGRPFVFTYHHNDPLAYVPLVLAMLDAGLDCTATFPAPAEMSASLHIAGAGSSIVDSIFVCRNTGAARQLAPVDSSAVRSECQAALHADVELLRQSDVRLTRTDVHCLAAGHIARLTVRSLTHSWSRLAPIGQRMATARDCLERITLLANVPDIVRCVAPNLVLQRGTKGSQLTS
jgi:adenine-specific DNA methylase